MHQIVPRRIRRELIDQFMRLFLTDNRGHFPTPSKLLNDHTWQTPPVTATQPIGREIIVIPSKDVPIPN
jgi:hypothetical protein